jgi:hypothetical protein
MSVDPHDESLDASKGEKPDESLVQVTGGLSAMTELDPAGDVDDATLIRVRNIVDMHIAKEESALNSATKRARSWFPRVHPGLRNAGVAAMAVFVFAAGVVTAPVLESDPAAVIAPSGAATQRNALSTEMDGALTSDMGSAAKSAIWWGNTRTRLVDSLSSDVNPGSGVGYVLAADDRTNGALVKVVAQRFGLAGDVVLPEWGGAQIGNGTDETVYVNGGNGQLPTWGYNNPAIDPWRACWATDSVPGGAAVTNSAQAGEDTTAATSEPVSAPVTDQACSPQATDQLGDVEAKKLALQLLEGLAYEKLELEITREPSSLMVTAYPVIGGKRSTATSWGITLVGSKVWGAYGTFLRGDGQRSYALITASEAIERANDVRFSTYPVYPEGFVFPGGALTPVASSRAGANSDLIPWPVESVSIVSASLGTTPVTTEDGILVLPAWELTSQDGRMWSVIAVEESALDFTARDGSDGIRPMAAEVRTSR